MPGQSLPRSTTYHGRRPDGHPRARLHQSRKRGRTHIALHRASSHAYACPLGQAGGDTAISRWLPKLTRTRATAAIINMIVLSCSQWGEGVVYLAWGLWWFDVVVSLACCVSMPFIV